MEDTNSGEQYAIKFFLATGVERCFHVYGRCLLSRNFSRVAALLLLGALRNILLRVAATVDWCRLPFTFC